MVHRSPEAKLPACRCQRFSRSSVPLSVLCACPGARFAAEDHDRNLLVTVAPCPAVALSV